MRKKVKVSAKTIEDVDKHMHPIARTLIHLYQGFVTSFEVRTTAQMTLILLGCDDPEKVRRALPKIGISVGRTAKSLIFTDVVDVGVCSIAYINDPKEWNDVDYDQSRLTPGDLSLDLGQLLDDTYLAPSLYVTPHLLLCGMTQSGKTATLRAIFLSLKLSQLNPMVMFIDPKNTNAFLADHCTHFTREKKEGADILEKVVMTAEGRIDFLSSVGCETMQEFNDMPKEEKGLYGQQIKAFNADYPDQFYYSNRLKRMVLRPIICIVDELKDFFDSDDNEHETLRQMDRDDPNRFIPSDIRAKSAVKTIASKMRSVGVHLILSTTYILADELSSSTASNLTMRLILRLQNKTQSNTALGYAFTPSANSLPPSGAFMFTDNNNTTPLYGRAPYISRKDIVTLLDQDARLEQLAGMETV